MLGCGANYAQSWCNIQGAPGQLYYGRGWFQLSFPCNYYAAGQSLGLDLLNNPDLVSQQLYGFIKRTTWLLQLNKEILQQLLILLMEHSNVMEDQKLLINKHESKLTYEFDNVLD